MKWQAKAWFEQQESKMLLLFVAPGLGRTDFNRIRLSVYDYGGEGVNN